MGHRDKAESCERYNTDVVVLYESDDVEVQEMPMKSLTAVDDVIGNSFVVGWAAR